MLQLHLDLQRDCLPNRGASDPGQIASDDPGADRGEPLIASRVRPRLMSFGEPAQGLAPAGITPESTPSQSASS